MIRRVGSQLVYAAAGLLALMMAAPDIVDWAGQSLATLFQITLASLALWLLPGLALLRLLWREPAGHWLTLPERLGLAIALSAALPPLLLLACQVLGVTWSAPATIGYLLLGAILLLLRIRPTLRAPNFAGTWLALLTGLALLVRLYIVRDLPVGLFGDSVHHTMITQLLIDHGGIFQSWAPYAPLTTFTYHYGFHANAAFLSWLTGVPVLRAVVLTAQIQNALTVPVAFALGARITTLAGASARRALWVGLFAALITGFVNPMPLYFVNWGRDTQLTGQLVLPGLLLCWLQLFDAARSRAGRGALASLIALCGIITACLMLTHYIVTLFAVLWLGTAWLAYAAAALRGPPRARALALLAGVSLAVCGLALLLAAPWLFNTLGGFLGRNTGYFVSGAADARRVADNATLRPVAPFFVSAAALWLAAAGFPLALLRRHWHVALFGVWSALLIVAITPGTFRLPGAGVVDYLTGYIALYITLAPLAGYALAEALSWLDALLTRALNAPRPAHTLGVLALIVTALWGVGWQRNVLDPEHFQLLTPADLAAMRWIRANTPAGARFLAQAFPAYGGTLIAGSDGGWWLGLLSGRDSALPPLTYGSERGVADRPQVDADSAGLWTSLRGRPLTDGAPATIDLTSAGARALLRDARVTHVYIGAHSSPARESVDHIDLPALRASPAFERVYAVNGVEIFAVR